MLGLLGSFLGHIYGGWWPGLLISVVLALFNIVGLITMTLPYLRGQQMGVITLSTEQVVGMQTVTNEFQIYKISGSQMVDTGIYLTIKVKGSEFSRSHVGLLAVGDRLLLVTTRDPIDETLTTYQGSFSLITSDEITGLLAPDLEEHRDRLLPFSLMERYEGPNSAIELFINGQILLLLISLFGLWRFLTVTVFPEPEKAKPNPVPQPEPAPKPDPKVESVPAKKPSKKL